MISKMALTYAALMEETMKNSDQSQLIADVARDVVAQIAPEELPLFRATSVAYFKNPDKLVKKQMRKDEMLGFGVGEAVSLLTPTVLVVVAEAVTFVTAEVKKSIATESAGLISDLVKKQFKKFQPEEKKAGDNPPPLTLEQIAQVRKLAYQRFLQLKLSDAQANRLADAVVATLVSEAS
jgi:hypothetical protein